MGQITLIYPWLFSEIHYDFKISCYFLSRSDQAHKYLSFHDLSVKGGEAKEERVGERKEGEKANIGSIFNYLLIFKV